MQVTNCYSLFHFLLFLLAGVSNSYCIFPFYFQGYAIFFRAKDRNEKNYQNKTF